MDHLLVVPIQQGVPENFLNSLRQAGWRVSVTADVLRAKQLLQHRTVRAVAALLDEPTPGVTPATDSRPSLPTLGQFQRSQRTASNIKR